MKIYWLVILSVLLLGCAPIVFPPSKQAQTHAMQKQVDEEEATGLDALLAGYEDPQTQAQKQAKEEAREQAIENEAFERAVAAELNQDFELAQMLYQEAVDKGSAYAAQALGEMYSEGRGIAQDHQKALALFSQAAMAGLSSANISLGDAYFFGRGTFKNPKKAVEAYSRAAEQGDPYAQYMLSICYKEGIGVGQDLAQSVGHYFKEESSSGNAIAKYRVARNYQLGRGFTKSLEEAFVWMERAAEQKETAALVGLGDFYREGKVVSADPAQAMMLYHDAHERGSAYAEYNLGMMYYNGEGVPQDPSEAAHWFRIAAKHGAEHAQYRLAQMYYEGEGINQDDVEAFAWWSISAKNKVEGKHLPQLNRLIERMSPKEQKEALELAQIYAEEYHTPQTPD